MNKPDEQTLDRMRIRIAELRGWKSNPYSIGWYAGETWAKRTVITYGLPPDYSRDLNAIRDAANSLCRDLESGMRFMDHLAAIVEPLAPFELQMAEAWQLAVALDRTLSAEPIV